MLLSHTRIYSDGQMNYLTVNGCTAVTDSFQLYIYQHSLPLQSVGARGLQHMREQWCQPPVDYKEREKYDTVHGVICCKNDSNTRQEIVSKSKDVNLDDIWALVEEKETSGKLTRNDGIGDEWRG